MSFAPPSLADIVRSLYGVWLIFVRDARAGALLDTSLQGFWSSFFAAALALPAVIPTILLYPGGGDAAHPGGGLDVDLLGLVRAIEIYAVMVLAYPLAVSFPIAALDREDNFVDYVVAYNWANLPIAYLGAIVLLLDYVALLPATFLNLLSFVTYAAIFYLLWRVARAMLDLTELQAAGIVLFEFISTGLMFLILHSIAA